MPTPETMATLGDVVKKHRMANPLDKTASREAAVKLYR